MVKGRDFPSTSQIYPGALIPPPAFPNFVWKSILVITGEVPPPPPPPKQPHIRVLPYAPVSLDRPLPRAFFPRVNRLPPLTRQSTLVIQCNKRRPPQSRPRNPPFSGGGFLRIVLIFSPFSPSFILCVCWPIHSANTLTPLFSLSAGFLLPVALVLHA